MNETISAFETEANMTARISPASSRFPCARSRRAWASVQARSLFGRIEPTFRHALGPMAGRRISPWARRISMCKAATVTRVPGVSYPSVNRSSSSQPSQRRCEISPGLLDVGSNWEECRVELLDFPMYWQALSACSSRSVAASRSFHSYKMEARKTCTCAAAGEPWAPSSSACRAELCPSMKLAAHLLDCA